ncbi:hypothetical protein ACOMHN_032536 [Nucella lapillus]
MSLVPLSKDVDNAEIIFKSATSLFGAVEPLSLCLEMQEPAECRNPCPYAWRCKSRLNVGTPVPVPGDARAG